MDTLQYQSGFGNEFSTECLPGALPVGRNSPQRVAYGLYAEQLSGTAFTAPRADNRRSWLYRIRPAAMHGKFTAYVGAKYLVSRFNEIPINPNQLRWSPPCAIGADVDFIDGLITYAGNGDAPMQAGVAVHIYCITKSMSERAFYNADGEMLIVLQQGRLRFATELGVIDAKPHEIVVIPRGVRFKVQLLDGEGALHRGYVCENFGALLKLPDLGPIGSNGLANPRDFLTPIAAYEDVDSKHELIAKFGGNLWRAEMNHSPLDVVAWHGNYAPYKYDLRRFNTIGSISFDHPDPSIFLVLHSASDTPGVSNLDFVIFPPRVLAMQDTFRPPWFHRNVASEFMGLIHGAYDAKAEGFLPGGASLHNSFTGHGPDAETFEKASNADTTKPHYITDTMAFMFESRFVFRPTKYALECAELQRDYADCWQGLKKHFDPRNV
jgi:homogentisate 1,2-dioxygenase